MVAQAVAALAGTGCAMLEELRGDGTPWMGAQELTKDGWHGSNLCTRVVLVEVFHCPVLWRCREAVQIVHIAHGLKVSTADKQVDRPAGLFANVVQCGIDRVELAMAAAIDRHLYVGLNMVQVDIWQQQCHQP